MSAVSTEIQSATPISNLRTSMFCCVGCCSTSKCRISPWSSSARSLTRPTASGPWLKDSLPCKTSNISDKQTDEARFTSTQADEKRGQEAEEREVLTEVGSRCQESEDRFQCRGWTPWIWRRLRTVASPIRLRRVLRYTDVPCWSLLNKKRIWRSSFSELTLSSPYKMRGTAKATLCVRGNLSSSWWWSLKWMTQCRRPRSTRLGQQPKSYLPAETSLSRERTDTSRSVSQADSSGCSSE